MPSWRLRRSGSRSESHELAQLEVAATQPGPAGESHAPNDRFRLPSDPEAPVIMIGAGAGIAPYRAFAQQREVHGARGTNWLIFGERTMRSDFPYQMSGCGT